MIDILFSSYPLFLSAMLLTLKLTVVALVMGCFVGLVVAFFRISDSKVLNTIAHIYITVIRGTPLIVQIAILYFGISSLVTLSAFWAGAIALAIHNGAYIGEIFRGAIQSIDRGQMEASRSLGMPYSMAMRRIILPQAFRRAIPALGNQFIIGLKDSSLVAYVGMSDLWGAALSEAASNYRQLDTYMVVGVYYLVLIMLFTYFVNKLEGRLSNDRRSAKPQSKDSGVAA
ncbi:amino acid ABC transporter permease [Brevibacillus fluminis]|uniref:Amino acid ABC transporter permease n=1 Tax=Brevibacillus fluminis TaxID=511487 RepID=A0A3M8DTL6_9BACL|nr:amino acid ABC transporter permease [Brevibacillus fluminis]RNB91264.1 amino acid ABC transporter permease [Brevibacillus fluminis]